MQVCESAATIKLQQDVNWNKLDKKNILNIQKKKIKEMYCLGN